MQVTYFKDNNVIGQNVTLAQSNSGHIEEDGDGVFTKKILAKGGKLQNIVFNLHSRSIIGDHSKTLSRETVCNISNAVAKLYLGTVNFGGEVEEDDSDEERKSEALGDNSKQLDYEQTQELASNVRLSSRNKEGSHDPQPTTMNHRELLKNMKQSVVQIKKGYEKIEIN